MAFLRIFDREGRLVELVLAPVEWWRGSIQVRMILSTVVLTVVAASAIGTFLVYETRHNLITRKVESVLAEASDEISDARTRLAAASGTQVDAATQRRDLVEPIITRGLARGFSVALTGAAGGARIADGGAEFTPGLDLADVPSALQQSVALATGAEWTYTSMRRPGGGAVAAVAIAATLQLPADGRPYTLYLLFPMDQEAATLSLLTRALLIGGSVLVLLVGLASWVVVRHVVSPIRHARRTAERLASGELHERMSVSGIDDIGRLAVSFNQMAANLQEQIRALTELSRVQRRFTSDVSHELRTPLTTVRMAAEMLHDARTDFDPVTARSAELLHQEVDRFEELLVDLLEISRMDAGAAVLNRESIDLVELCRRVVQRAEPLAQANGVRIEVIGVETAIVAADARRIERIVRNLVSNAIDHSIGVGEVVTVEIGADERAVAVAVRDHGIGLAPGETAMVFNRFWRADPARARTSGGTGLGLAIALEDAQLHRGWLQAWGRKGEGAAFRLTLPRRNGVVLTDSPLHLVPEEE